MATEGNRPRGKAIVGQNKMPPRPTTPPTGVMDPPSNSPRAQWMQQTRPMLGLSPTRQRSGSPTRPTISPTTSPLSSPRSEVGSGGDSLSSLTLRLESVGKWMKEARGAHPEIVGAMVENFKAAAAALKTDLIAAGGLIEKLERAKHECETGVSESSSSESEPEKTPDVSELRSRLQEVVVFSKSLTDTDAAGRIQGASRLVLTDLKANNLKDAEQKLLRLEAVVEKLGGKKPTSDTPPTVTTSQPPVTTPTPIVTTPTPLTPT